jgi:hypothetical protein
VTQPPSAVVTGEFWTGSTEHGLAHGLRALGWGVHEVDRARHALHFGPGIVARAARRLTTRTPAARAYRGEIVDAVHAIGPDFLLAVKGADLDIETLQAARRRGTRTVMFYPDYHFDHADVAPATFAHYDCFITTKSFQVDYLRQRLPGALVAHVHHGYNDEVHRRYLHDVGEDDHAADVAYCGNHTPYKQRWLEALAAALPDLRLRIVGHRWREAARGALAGADISPGCVGYGYARTIQLSRINVALHGGPGGSQGWEDLVSTRTFEIPACGGFMLHVDNAEVRTLFDVGTEIDVFDDVASLAARIRHYLAQPERRAAMRAAAHRRCVPAHGYAARAASIATILARLPAPAG